MPNLMIKKSLKTAALLGSLIFSGASQADPLNLLNAGFESSWTGIAQFGSDGHVPFYYGPTGPDVGWVFGPSTGVAGSYDSLTAYEGSQFAFLQLATAPLSQGFTLDSAAAVTLDFALALRPNYATGQKVQVLIDGQQAGLFDASTTTWTVKSLSLGNLTAGNHVLSFAGLATYAEFGDTTAFIDAVHLDATAVPEPQTWAMFLTGMIGLMLWRRRAGM